MDHLCDDYCMTILHRWNCYNSIVIIQLLIVPKLFNWLGSMFRDFHVIYVLNIWSDIVIQGRVTGPL